MAIFDETTGKGPRQVYPMHDSLPFCSAALSNISDGVYFVDRQRTITFWNKAAEKITGYNSSEVSGTACDSDILMHIDDKGTKLCTGMCPLAKTLQDGLIREEVVYLYHKSGHRIPVSARFIPIWDNSKAIVGAVEVFRDISSRVKEAAKIKTLAKMAYIDPLTELVNRPYIEYRLGLLLRNLSAGGLPFGVLMLDVHQFKRLNENYGTRVGDQILKILARTLYANVGQTDIVGRWIGAKYIIVAPTTNKGLLLLQANKLKTLVEQSGLKISDTTLTVKVSVSGAMAHPTDTVDSLLERAEKILAYNLVRVQ